MDISNLTLKAVNAALLAGKEILEVYNKEDFGIKIKEDKSPLTEADLKSNNVIKSMLTDTNISILSEEEKEVEYNDRKNWGLFWLVDPLDGTKEFIKRNGEFTVNIALVEKTLPIAGVVYVPFTGEMYFANQKDGSFKGNIKVGETVSTFEELTGKSETLPCNPTPEIYTAVGSRSHMSDETLDFVEKLKLKYGKVEMVSKGSALKLCLVAEGKADIYPRFGPTMEWDTGAGHAVVKFSGAKIYHTDKPTELEYNKKNLLNPYFIVERERI